MLRELPTVLVGTLCGLILYVALSALYLSAQTMLLVLLLLIGVVVAVALIVSGIRDSR